MIFLLFRSVTQSRQLVTWRWNRYTVTNYQPTLRKILEKQMFHLHYWTNLISSTVRQRGREIPISLNCKQGGDLHNRSSRNTCVIWLPLCVVIFTRILVITWPTTWKHIVLQPLEEGWSFVHSNNGLWKKQDLRKFY